MINSEYSEKPQTITIQLEILPEDEQDPDPATMNEVGLHVSDALKKDGYTVRPAYTGERGGVLLIIAGITFAVHQIWIHREGIIELFKSATPVIQSLFKERERRAAKGDYQGQPIKAKIKIEDVSIDVEGPDLESVESIMKLADSFRTKHPQVAEKVTPQSLVTVQALVSKTPRPRKR